MTEGERERLERFTEFAPVGVPGRAHAPEHLVNGGETIEVAGISFECLADTWVLQILPGYVFTTDGRYDPLNSQRVTALATRRASRDYNSHVHNDLVFWTWVISGGEAGMYTLDSHDGFAYANQQAEGKDAKAGRRRRRDAKRRRARRRSAHKASPSARSGSGPDKTRPLPAAPPIAVSRWRRSSAAPGRSPLCRVGRRPSRPAAASATQRES